jgi:methyltransferase (TIGR00027 family)
MADLMAFKEEVVTGVPGTARVSLAVDLREDFAEPLTSAGFDPAAPALWLAEGLLPYLTQEAADALLDRVGALSAAGSVLLLDQLSSAIWPLVERHGEQVGALDRVGASWRSTVDDPAGWLAAKGWKPRLIDMADAAARLGRDLPVLFDASAGVPAAWLAAATRA